MRKTLQEKTSLKKEEKVVITEELNSEEKKCSKNNCKIKRDSAKVCLLTNVQYILYTTVVFQSVPTQLRINCIQIIVDTVQNIFEEKLVSSEKYTK